ncbi:portal protein [Sphingobium sp. TomMM35A]
MNVVQRVLATLRKTWTPDTGRSGFHDRDNFVTNRVTVADWNDARCGNAALGISATWACVNLLAGTIGSLPLMVYRERNGRREVDKGHRLYPILHDTPNRWQTAVDFWGFIQGSLELYGNAYAEKRTLGTGISSLIPIPPEAMTVRRISREGLEYEWMDNGIRSIADESRVLHIRGFGGGPLGGASTLAVCGRAFSAGLNVEGSASSMFRNGARPSGVLSIDKPLTKDQRLLAETLLQEKFVGAMNDGRPMLLDNGMKWEQLAINPHDAQMLESRRFSVEEICRIFGVPPHMVGHTESSTSWGTGLEQQTLGFQKFALRPRLERIEQALAKQLLTPQDRAAGVTIEFNLEGLLRGDSAARAQFYREMTGIGAMTINEVRALENLPPVTGGDVPRMQMQNVPITQEVTP